MGNPFRAAAKSVALDHQRTPSQHSSRKGDVTWDGERGWSLLRGVRKDAPYTFEQLVYEAFRKNGVVSACVRAITSSLSEAPIYAYKPGGEPDTWERQRGHYAEELMQYPNRKDDSVTIIERTGQHFLLGGNGYWRKYRLGSGRVDRIVPIRPDRVVKTGVDAEELPLYYDIQDADNPTRKERVDADDIVHFVDVDPLNEVFGMPRLLSAALDTHSDNQASEYVSEILSNHGSPGLLIGVNENAKPQQIRDAEERFQDKFGPGKGRGKTGFVPGASTVREIGFNLNQLEFPDLRAISRETICAVFGVDPLLIGIGSAARAGSLNGTEAVAALRRLWTQTLIPLIRRWEARINTQLSPDLGDIFLFFEVSQIEALQEPRGEAVKRALEMKQVGGYTLGEIRSETGHDPRLPADSVVLQDTKTTALPSSYLLDASGLEEERERERELSEAFAEAEGGDVDDDDSDE